VNGSKLKDLFADILESLKIGVERSPKNSSKILSNILLSLNFSHPYLDQISQIGHEIATSLTTQVDSNVESFTR